MVITQPIRPPEARANDIVIAYDAYPKQRLFHLSDAEITIYGGAKGGGKSCALVMDAVSYAIKFDGAKIYLFRRTFDELEANLVDELFKRCPEKTKDNPNGLFTYDKSRHIAYIGKSRIFFRYIRNLQDARKYAGREMDYCGVDELTQHVEEAIQILMSCMRSPRGFPTRFKATCNPGDIGHAWVKKNYIDATTYGTKDTFDKATGSKIKFIPAKVYDNLMIMEKDPRYLRRLRNLPPTLRRAFLDGDWNIFENQAFEEFRPDVHIVKHFAIPKHWRRWRSCDNGYADPFAFYWFAVSPEGIVHVYREYTRLTGDPKIAYSEQAKKVIELSKYRDIDEKGAIVLKQEKCDFTIVGHDAWNVRPETKTATDPRGKSIIDHYREGGLKDCQRAIIDRKLRRATIHEYLRVFYDKNCNKDRAKVVIHDCCRMLIETLPAQVNDEKDIEKYAETDYDHWVDSFGYGLLAYHAPRSKDPKKEETTIAKHKHSLAKRINQRRVS